MSIASLNGTYLMSIQDGGVFTSESSVTEYIGATEVSITFDGSGECTASENYQNFELNLTSPTSILSDAGNTPYACSYTVSPAGVVMVDFGGGAVETWQLSTDSQVLLYGGLESSANPDGDNYDGWQGVGVKLGTEMAIADLNGIFTVRSTACELYDDGASPTPYFESNVWANSFSLSFDGAGTCSILGYEANGYGSAIDGSSGIWTSTDTTPTVPCTYVVASNGLVTLSIEGGTEALWLSGNGNMLIAAKGVAESDGEFGTLHYNDQFVGTKNGAGMALSSLVGTFYLNSQGASLYEHVASSSYGQSFWTDNAVLTFDGSGECSADYISARVATGFNDSGTAMFTQDPRSSATCTYSVASDGLATLTFADGDIVSMRLSSGGEVLTDGGWDVTAGDNDDYDTWQSIAIKVLGFVLKGPKVALDFNGDGRSEILWRNASDGQNRIWQMDGFTRTAGSNIMNLAGAGWEVGGTSDFDGDGNSDIMWRDQGGDGQNRLWLMDGFSRTGGNVLPLMIDTNWIVGGIDDFDGDGQADILWRNTVKPLNRIWLMNTFVKKSGGTIPLQANDWIVGGTGDFDNDGKADILWRNTVNGQNRIWLMNGLTQSSGANIPNMTDTNWEIGGVGDFDGDSKVDILWRNSTNGQNRVWLMDGLTRKLGASIKTLAGATWVVGSVGDYNADGKSDVLWRDTETGLNMIWLMDGANTPGIQQGTIPWLESGWSAVQ